jgi:hypothetical protein
MIELDSIESTFLSDLESFRSNSHVKRSDTFIINTFNDNVIASNSSNQINAITANTVTIVNSNSFPISNVNSPINLKKNNNDATSSNSLNEHRVQINTSSSQQISTDLSDTSISELFPNCRKIDTTSLTKLNATNLEKEDTNQALIDLNFCNLNLDKLKTSVFPDSSSNQNFQESNLTKTNIKETPQKKSVENLIDLNCDLGQTLYKNPSDTLNTSNITKISQNTSVKKSQSNIELSLNENNNNELTDDSVSLVENINKTITKNQNNDTILKNNNNTILNDTVFIDEPLDSKKYISTSNLPKKSIINSSVTNYSTFNLNKPIKKLNYPKLGEGLSYKCWVSYVDSPLLFWVQLDEDSDEIKEFERKLK